MVGEEAGEMFELNYTDEIRLVETTRAILGAMAVEGAISPEQNKNLTNFYR